MPDFAGDDLVHDRGAHQDDLHQVLVLAEERLQPGLRLLGGEHVGAVLRPPPSTSAAPTALVAGSTSRLRRDLVRRHLVPARSGAPSFLGRDSSWVLKQQLSNTAPATNTAGTRSGVVPCCRFGSLILYVRHVVVRDLARGGG